MGTDVVLDDDGEVPVDPVDSPGRLRRRWYTETTVGPHFRLIIDGVKESELVEIVDLLRSRGWLV
jgi:hypothetical protein